jgi:hypothetical protein
MQFVHADSTAVDIMVICSLPRQAGAEHNTPMQTQQQQQQQQQQLTAL